MFEQKAEASQREFIIVWSGEFSFKLNQNVLKFLAVRWTVFTDLKTFHLVASPLMTIKDLVIFSGRHLKRSPPLDQISRSERVDGFA